jgi:cytochrome b involved in lipid metabolism
MSQYLLQSSLFDTIGGLPIHPLAVHVAVVLLPLSALALAALIFVPKWRKAYLPITLAGLGVSTLFAYLAKESGETLADRVGEPQTHEALGEILFPAAIGLLALGVAFYFLQRSQRPKWQVQAAGAAALLAIASVTTLTYFVGHTGAEATWANRINPVSAAPITNPDPASTDSTAAALTAEEVASHNTEADCWTVVDGTVYNLTSYISNHPGGAGPLTSLCGKDGSAAFSSQHGSQAAPVSALAALAVGVLGAPANGAAVPDASAEPTATPSATAAAGSFTAAEVAKHNTGTDCWSVVSGNVYDLTPYVSSHPGGASVIKAICGKDGSAAFAGQHSGASKPANVLASYKLGTLAAGAAAAATLPQANVPAGEGEEEEGEGDDD